MTYRVYSSNAPVDPGEPDWRFRFKVTKWGLREALRTLYAEGYCWISILVVRERP